MKSAGELLGVIESSRLELSEELAERRGEILRLIDQVMGELSHESEDIAERLTGLLVDKGVVLGDREDIREVIEEYLDVVASEQSSLGDEEKDFLESFLK